MPELWGDEMFKWFRERRIVKSVEAARIFLIENYKEPPKTSSGTSSGIRYSRRAEPKFSRDVKYSISFSEEPKPKAEEKSEVKYSLKTPDIKFSDRDVQYSFRDNYDSQSIDRAVRSLSSSDSPLKALRTLEDNTNMSFVDKMLDYINIKVNLERTLLVSVSSATYLLPSHSSSMVVALPVLLLIKLGYSTWL